MKHSRIALVVDHFLPRIGGIETQVSELARQLQLAGHDVTVITTTPDNDEPCALKVERIPARLIPKYQVAWTLGPLRKLRQFFVAQAFDIVHCHSSVYSPLAYSALVWCQQLRLPSMLTVHSVVRNTSRIFGELDRYVQWRNWPVVWSTVSHFNADLISRYARLPEVHVLPNGIHPHVWDVQPREHHDLRVTSVLRLNRKKRPHDMIRAIPTILQGCRDVPVRFSVIGNGPLRNSVERLATRLGIAQFVDFHGSLSPPAIRDVFARTDVFMHPTTTEAFGIAVLEALSAGLPVVARAGCGIADLVKHGEQGFLAADPEAFAEYAIRLLNDAELRRQMGIAARTVAARFSWKELVERHLELYEHAMNLRGVKDGTVRRYDPSVTARARTYLPRDASHSWSGDRSTP